MKCSNCKTELLLEEKDDRIGGGESFHYYCVVRIVAGSVGHQLRLCTCFGGNKEDPPHLTRKEAALAAYYLYMGRNLPLCAVIDPQIWN